MPTFTCPSVRDRLAFGPDATEEQKALFKFQKTLNPRYVSVFYLSDGSFVQDTGTAENSNTNVPYPWDPNNPSAPYVTSVYYDVSQTPAPLVIDQTSHPVWIVAVMNGVVTVSSAMATLLTNYTAYGTGYGALIT